MKMFLLAYAFVGLISCGLGKPLLKQNEILQNAVYGPKDYRTHETQVQVVHSGQIYHGKYGGKCTSDGLYYNNKYSFMICSNGNAYEQHCAPGSMNSGYERYEFGKDYYYHDFCDVNLVDTGYTTQQGYGDGYGAGYDGHEAEYHHEHHGNEGYAVLEKHESDYPAPGQAAAVYPMQGKQNKGYPGRGKQDPSYPNFGKTDRDYPMSGKQDRGYSAKGGDYTNSKNFEAQRYGYGKGYKAGYD